MPNRLDPVASVDAARDIIYEDTGQMMNTLQALLATIDAMPNPTALSSVRKLLFAVFIQIQVIHGAMPK